MIAVRELFEATAEHLWSMHHQRIGRPRLVFPTKRDGSVRVSEQASRTLACQELEEQGTPHSIETATRERYRQSGQCSQSARIDLALYRSREPKDRVLNLEFKAGLPKSEEFRKDLEKLLREGVRGGWFHTLERP